MNSPAAVDSQQWAWTSFYVDHSRLLLIGLPSVKFYFTGWWLSHPELWHMFAGASSWTLLQETSVNFRVSKSTHYSEVWGPSVASCYWLPYRNYTVTIWLILLWDVPAIHFRFGLQQAHMWEPLIHGCTIYTAMDLCTAAGSKGRLEFLKEAVETVSQGMLDLLLYEWLRLKA